MGVQLDFQMKFYLLIASLLLLVYKFKAANVPIGSPNAAQERNDKNGIPMTRTIRGTNPRKNGNDNGTGKKKSGGKSKGKTNQERRKRRKKGEKIRKNKNKRGAK